jgi:peroxiredoxin
VHVIGISSDSTFALKTYADSLKLPFPLLTDPKLTAITRYGVLAADKVRAYRAFFLVDPQGVLRKQWLLGPEGDNIVFSSEPIIRAVEELKRKR